MLPQLALAQLEAAVVDGCATEEEWPARVSAGIYAGVDFAIAHPDAIEWLGSGGMDGYSLRRHQTAVSSLSKLLEANVPVGRDLPLITGDAVIGGLIGLVGEQLRLNQVNRLRALRPDLVLLVLLPYLGFEEAQNWANRAASERV